MVLGPSPAEKALAETARGVAIRAAQEAGRLLRRQLWKAHRISYKDTTHLVTEADLVSERAIVEVIREYFPDHQVLAEEGSKGGTNPDFRWIIDPLDGTTNYAHGVPFFAVSIGLEAYGEIVLGVVYDPNQRELFIAEKSGGASLNGRAIHVSGISELSRSLLVTGFPYERQLLPLAMRQFEAMSYRCQAVRRTGSAALDLCYVAAGRFDGYWEVSVYPWDVAAGSLIVTEAGGAVSDLGGGPFRVDGGTVLASNGRLHQEMVELLGQEHR